MKLKLQATPLIPWVTLGKRLTQFSSIQYYFIYLQRQFDFGQKQTGNRHMHRKKRTRSAQMFPEDIFYKLVELISERLNSATLVRSFDHLKSCIRRHWKHWAKITSEMRCTLHTLNKSWHPQTTKHAQFPNIADGWNNEHMVHDKLISPGETFAHLRVSLKSRWHHRTPSTPCEKLQPAHFHSMQCSGRTNPNSHIILLVLGLGQRYQ